MFYGNSKNYETMKGIKSVIAKLLVFVMVFTSVNFMQISQSYADVVTSDYSISFTLEDVMNFASEIDSDGNIEVPICSSDALQEILGTDYGTDGEYEITELSGAAGIIDISELEETPVVLYDGTAHVLSFKFNVESLPLDSYSIKFQINDTILNYSVNIENINAKSISVSGLSEEKDGTAVELPITIRKGTEQELFLNYDGIEDKEELLALIKDNLIISSSKSTVAVAELSEDGDSIVITPTKNTGSTKITLQPNPNVFTGGTNKYSFNVNVTDEPLNFTVTAPDVTADADGLVHYARIKSSIPNVVVRYGLDGNLNHILDIENAEQFYNLTEVGMVVAGKTTIDYQVSKDGYVTQTGSVKLCVDDGTAPQPEIRDLTHKATSTQTATLYAQDGGKIKSFYFGTKANPDPNEYEELDVPVVTFERRYFEISAGGVYHFKVIGLDGNQIGDTTLQMGMLHYIAGKEPINNGNFLDGNVVSEGNILVQVGAENDLPVIAAPVGYDELKDWEYGGYTLTFDGEIPLPIDDDTTAKYTSADGKFVLSGLYDVMELTGVFEEQTATVIYNNNNHGESELENQTIYYSKEATAAAELTANGYVFDGWNTKEDGRGMTFAPGEIIKEASAAPEDMTLFAMWSPADITFEDESFNELKASEEAQFVEISEPVDGTGEYEYEITAQTADEFFSISGDNSIEIAAGTPAGNYVITLKATDKETSAEATAVYQFKLSKNDASLTLATSDATMSTQDERVLDITKQTDGELTVTSNDTSIATAEVIDDALVINTKDKIGSAVITVKSTETDIYKEASASCTVTVSDMGLPTGTITEITNDWANKQTVTLSASDNSQIVAFYFGTSENGELQAIEPVKNFERQNVPVKEGPGTYYFIVKDSGNHVETVAQQDFYATTFIVENGSTTISDLLLASGTAFNLPAITAATGYTTNNTWTVSGDGTEISVNEEYTVNGSATLKADCDEITATLHYNNNGIGTQTLPDDTMYYTKETTAAPALIEIDGYKFMGWNTDSEGNGTFIAAGSVVKQENVVPTETTLWAVWDTKELVFEDQTFANLVASTEPQRIAIVSAEAGNGVYNYDILGQPENFEVVGNEIVIDANTPAGTYTLAIRATDAETEKTAIATYKLKIDRMDYSISLASSDVTMATSENRTIAINNPINGDLTVSSNMSSVAYGEIDNNELTIISKDATGNATITVTFNETGLYKAASAECNVQVINKKINISAPNVTFSADGIPHTASVSADVDNVEFRYGTTDGNYNHVINLGESGSTSELTDVVTTALGVTTIYYKASCSGYDDEFGTITITISDSEAPTGTITCTTDNLSMTQLVTLSANDNDSIVGIYFGQEQDGEVDPITPSQNFERQKVVVDEGEGTYYFRVKDNSGQTYTVAQLDFYRTTFVVEHGSTSIDSVLMANGKSFILPEITAATGYTKVDTWTVSGEETTYSVNEIYAPTNTATLTACCTENTAEITYSNNGIGTQEISATAMSFTKEATAAPGLENVAGYTFAGWNTESEGNGTFYGAGAVVKGENVDPIPTTLFAVWTKNEISLEDKSFLDMSTSENAQYVEISAASNGTGEYEYSVLTHTGNYFSVVEGNKIEIAANTPAGEYAINVQAEDTTTQKKTVATYNFKLTRMVNTLTLASESVTMETSNTTEPIDITSFSDGLLSATISDTNIATAEIVNNDALLITSKDATGNATITIKAAETDIYTSAEATFQVTVVNKTFTVTATNVSANADSLPHMATIQASIPGVEVRYSTSDDGEYKHVLNIVNENQDYEFTEAARTYLGITPIYYKASKAGYEDIYGVVYAEVYDTGVPTGMISNVTNNPGVAGWNSTPTQKLTLSASDNDTIEAYYFGLDVDYSEDLLQDITPVHEFVKQNVVVDEGGEYAFYAKDSSGHIEKIDEIAFVYTDFAVYNGTAKFSNLGAESSDYLSALTALGYDYGFELPQITPNEGYNPLAVWECISDGEEYNTLSNYVPDAETAAEYGYWIEMEAECKEKTAKLTYDNNGHGTTVEEDVTETELFQDIIMNYTDEVIAAPALSADGYTFDGWNTQADGHGTRYAAGAVIKAANTEPHDMVLYAIWTSDEISLADQSFNLVTSENAQMVDISAAANGTGEYKYKVVTQSEDYFSVNAANDKIVIAAKTPAGAHTITVEAEDVITHEKARATYSFTFERMNHVPTLTSEDATMSTLDTLEIKIASSSDGVPTATVDNDIVVASISEDSLIVRSGGNIGEATVTVTVPQTDLYNEASIECRITVEYRQLTITAPDVVFEAGVPAIAKISSSSDGVEVRYGINGNYNHILNIVSADTEYDLSDCIPTDLGDTTISYRAIKSGFAVCEDELKITINDETNPTGTITEPSKNLTDKQTVTLSASDNSKIVAYYFGKEENGVPLELPTAVGEFTREKVDVASGDGEYYFIVKDAGNNTYTVASMHFFGTTFTVEHGSTNLGTVLMASGDSFNLPEITAADGYTKVDSWKVLGEETEISANAEYKPTKTATLTANCTENTAEITYSNNGIGSQTVEPTAMSYTKEATAAPALDNVAGYTFKGWNTDEEGDGTFYKAGDTVKAANVNPESVELFAVWTENEISLEDKSFLDMSASENAQYVEISAASNGTGEYTYTVLSHTGNYFSVVEGNKIEIAEKTPAGEYAIAVKAEDTTTHQTTTATYNFKLTRMANTLTLASENATMATSTTTEPIDITTLSDGQLSAATTDTDVAIADIVNGKLVVTSKDKAGNATITVKVAETGIYTSAEATFAVTVKNKEFTVVAEDVEFEASGVAHYVSMSASVDGVKVYYGASEDALTSTATVGTSPVELKGVSITDIGTITVFYRATKTGYADVTGNAKITIKDETAPVVTYTETSAVASKQTITFTATDGGSGIVKYYWGNTASPADGDFTNVAKTNELVVSKEVSDSGQYYFIVKDNAGKASVSPELVYYKTSLVVTNGKSTTDYVITKKDGSFALPSIIADEGYTAPAKWSNELVPGAVYSVTANGTLTATCTENTAAISYSNNGHGGTAPANTQMSYTKEATAAAAMDDVKGYTFKGWNTDASGDGTFYKPGATVKAANKEPVAMTLFAIWETNDITLEGGSATLTASSSAQYVDIASAESGTDDYKYEIVGSLDNFTVEGQRIKVAENTPAGTYTVPIRATDNETKKTAVASYILTINPMSFVITIDNVTSEADGTDYCLSACATIDGVTLKYGLSEDALEYTTTIGTNTVALKHTPGTKAGTTTVYYSATKLGYEEVTGSATITLTDTTNPEVAYTVTNDVANKQTITFTATDTGVGINKYYFGTGKTVEELVDGDFKSVEGTNELEQSFEVSASGNYMYIVKDAENHQSSATNVKFHKTTLTVNNGTTVANYVITENGKDFNLPNIIANINYKSDGVKWKLDAIEYAQGDKFTPSSDAELVANCIGSALEFANQNIPITASENAQTVDITEPTTGTGEYEYTITNQSSNNYFSIVTGDSKLQIKEGTPAGQHALILKAVDKETSAQATAIYMFEISKMTAVITLASAECTVISNATGTIQISEMLTNGEITVTSTKPGIATAIVSGDSLIITPTGNESGETRITVTTEETGLYTKATAYCDVTVKAASAPLTGSVESITNDLADTQTVKLTAVCDSLVSSYSFEKGSEAVYTDITPTTSFTKDISITEPGTYHFKAKDSYGKVTEIGDIQFFKTTFSVTNGAVSVQTVLTESGKTFTLPYIQPSNGYTAPSKWSNGMSVGTTYAPTSSANLTANCIANTEEFKITDKGKNLTVGADLSVNFYFEIPDQYKGGTMTFRINHSEEVQTPSPIETEIGTRYEVAVNVNQMNDDITWEYKLDDKTCESKTPYTFSKYLASASTDTYRRALPKLAKFADSLKVYGYYAQNYLATECDPGFEIGVDHTAIPNPSIEPSDAEELSGYSLNVSGSNDNISADSTTVEESLILDSIISMVIYVPLSDTNTWTESNLPSVTVNGKPSDSSIIESEGVKKLRIEIPNVTTLKLADAYEIKIADSFTVTTSGLAYANMLKTSGSDLGKKLAAALYDIHKASVEYVAN